MDKEKDKFNDKVLNFKTELIYRDFDSLFSVYERETSIVFSFRGWTITMLTAYFGFLIVINSSLSSWILYSIPLFIIISFLFLEVAERSVMLKLLKEVRSIEKIFMERNINKLEKKIIDYEFRDLRDAKEKMKIKIGYFAKAIATPQVISWYSFLIISTIVIIQLILMLGDISSIEVTWSQ